MERPFRSTRVRVARARVGARSVRRERGQALVFLVALVAVLVAAFLVVFDTGQAVAHQQRLVNAADAAAYGGAAWEARMLNFQAYSNRAIVANEVALAQSVGVRSWSDYLGRTLTNLDVVARYVPYLGQATTALRRTWNGIDAGLQPSLQALEAVASGVNVALSSAQTVVHGMGVAGAEEIARRTLSANDPAFEPSSAAPALFAANAAAYSRFTTAYAGAARSRLRTTVLDGRDGFTRSRSSRLPVGPASLVVRLEKRGGTDLVGFDSWRGMDTLALHTRRGLVLGRFRERTPIGWGAAENARTSPAVRGSHDGSWRTNPDTSALAATRIGGVGRLRGRAYAGLQTTRDVVDVQRRDDRELRFAVDASMPANRIATSRTALGIGPLAVPGGPAVDPSARVARGRHFALGVARVQFDRPLPRADARREYPNLYSPYWVARLAAPTVQTRALAAAARGVPDPFGAVP